MFTIGITKGRWNTLVTALQQFKDDYDKNQPLWRILPEFVAKQPHYERVGLRDLCQQIHGMYKANDVARVTTEMYLSDMQPAMKPSDAFACMAHREIDRVEIDELEGRVTSVLLTPYPPGIPLLIPGERFNRTIVEYLKFARDFNAQFPGFDTDIHGLVEEPDAQRQGPLLHGLRAAALTRVDPLHARQGRGAGSWHRRRRVTAATIDTQRHASEIDHHRARRLDRAHGSRSGGPFDLSSRLAIDQGTHASRALVLDATRPHARAAARARSRSRARSRTGPSRTARRWSPRSSPPWRRRSRQLGARRRDDRRRAGLASQRASCVCWDRARRPAAVADLQLAGPARARLDRAIRGAHGEAVHRKTGLFLSPHYGASKLRWALDICRRCARRARRARSAGGRGELPRVPAARRAAAARRPAMRRAHAAVEPRTRATGIRSCWRSSACRRDSCRRACPPARLGHAARPRASRCRSRR